MTADYTPIGRVRSPYDSPADVSDEGELPWTQKLDMTAVKEDLGYEPQYDLESGFRKYINVLREEEGLDPIE